MSTITAKPPPAPAGRRFTPQDLLSLPEAICYELVDGELVERGMSMLSGWVSARLQRRLDEYCESKQLGWTFPAEVSYQCFPDDPDRVRRPDISFIRFGRLPGERFVIGHVRIAPDFAAEVVSPNDRASDLERKIKEYLLAGARLVWVIYPKTRSARIHRANGVVAEIGENDELTGEDVIPGFRCVLRDLFTPIDQQAQTTP